MRNLRGTAIVAALLAFSMAAAPTARANPEMAYYGPEPELLSEWQLRHLLDSVDYLIDSGDWGPIMFASTQLSVLYRRHVPLLQEALSNDRWRCRWNAIAALDLIGNEEAMAVLEEALRDSTLDVYDTNMIESVVAEQAAADTSAEYRLLVTSRLGRLLLFRFLLDDIRSISVTGAGQRVLHTFASWEHQWICNLIQGERLLRPGADPDQPFDELASLDPHQERHCIVIELAGGELVTFGIWGHYLRYTPTGQPAVSLSEDDYIIHSETLTGYASNVVSGDRYGHAVALGGSR